MRWLAEVHVSLRPGIADPEGQTIGGGLRSLGFASVSEVRAGKLLRIDFEADDSAAAEAAVAEMCRRLLASPVMETATWELRADGEWVQRKPHGEVRSTHVQLLADSWGRTPEMLKADGGVPSDVTSRQPAGD